MAANKVTKLALFIVLASVFLDTTEAQSGCTKTLIGLSPCLNYVSGNTSTPSASCCSQLSNVVTSQPQCLCLLLNGTATSYGYNINQTLALSLPQACSVQTPPLSKCNAANGPSASTDHTPQASPAADSSKEPATTIPSGSKTTPSVNGAYKGGSNNRALEVFFLFLATCSLFFAGF